jgi:hypothetical protein
VPILDALVHHRNDGLTGALRGKAISGLRDGDREVGVRSYTTTNFADSVWLIGTGLRSLFKTIALPSATSSN